MARIRDDKWQTHVYLDEDDFKKLKEIADIESRSTTMQIEYFLRQAIETYRRKQGSKG